jgi:DNA helicase II / ATP-dependent DNA helicase PcrA
LKFFIRSQLLLKAKKSPIGTIHKWHDGEYIKVGDHEWHKQKLKSLTIKAVTDHGKGRDPELIADMKKQLPPAMRDYAEHLIDLDHDPHHTKPNDYHDFFAQVFDDPEWDKNGWQSTADLMHTVLQNYHGMLHHEGKKKIKSSELKEGPIRSLDKFIVESRNVHSNDGPFDIVRIYKDKEGKEQKYAEKTLYDKKDAEVIAARMAKKFELEVTAHLIGRKKWLKEMEILERGGIYPGQPWRQKKQYGKIHKYYAAIAAKEGFALSDAVKKDYPELGDEVPPELNDPIQKKTNMIRSVDFSKTNKDQRFKVTMLLKDTNVIMHEMGVQFKSPLHFKVDARLGEDGKRAYAHYFDTNKTVAIHSFDHTETSMLHELGHAIDFAMTDSPLPIPRSEQKPEDAVLAEKYKELATFVKNTPYYKRTLKQRFKTYINKPTEVFARAFEVYGAVKARELVAQGKIDKKYIDKYVPNIYLAATTEQTKEYDAKITELMDYILKHDKIRKALVTVGLDVIKAKKGTGAPIGTKRKWADGTYVKKEDHKWHKEKLTKIAHDHLKEKKQKDPELKKEFTAVVHDLAEYMIDHDVHPEDLPKRNQHEFWSSAIDDEGFATDPGWQKYINAAHEVVKKYYGTLGRPEEKTSPPDKKPDKKQIAKPLNINNEEKKVMDDSPTPVQQEDFFPQEVNPPPHSEPEPVVAPDPEPAKKDFKPSIYQQKIFDWIKNGKGNAVIDAKAGSGKTATIVKALEMIPRNKSVIFLAFNTSARDELNERVPQWAVDQKAVRTLNSLGFAAWARQMGGYGQLRVDGSKTASIIRNTLEFEDQPYRHVVKDLVSKAKQAGLAPKMAGIDGIIPDTADSWYNLISHFNIDLSSHDPQKAINLARMILRKSIEEKRVIDFDDQFYMPIIHNSAWPKHDFMFVDEAQDVSDIQREAISRAADSRTRVIAVGDVNQCIYGFRGANPKSFDLLKKEFNAQTFDLPVSYRCAKKIIDSVKHLVPDIKARDDAPEGEVKDFGYEWDNKDFKQTDMIVCRNNAPLVSVAYKLLREKIPCKLMGRDIGSNITTLIKKWKPKNLKELGEEAARWSKNEIRIATARDPDADLTSIEDRYETIMTFLEETKADTVAGLVKEIEDMFAADDGAKSENILRLSTVHKAKGLEAPRVWLLNRELMPHKMAKLAWQKQQEDNLIYVAHTRAKQSLYFIQKDMPRGLKKAIDAMLGASNEQ